MINPLEQLDSWWKAAKINSPLKQKNAICVSTINTDGFPSGRFVDLKEVTPKGLIFCSVLHSNKGQEINQNPKTAITIWWDHVGYQIRVIGKANRISDELAQKYWNSRSTDAQIATLALEQSRKANSLNEVEQRFLSYQKQYHAQSFTKPKNWGGYIVEPSSIEFLTFKESRLHLRELYTKVKSHWQKTYLQP